MVFQERTYSVLELSASAAFDRTVSDLLPRNDFFPVNMVKSCGEARRALLDKEYDIVLINAPLQDDFGMRLAIDVCSTSHAGVLLCVKSALYNDVYSKVTPHGVLTLSKPTSLPMITHSLRVLCALRERLRKLEAKQQSVEERMEEIRLVNRAKWLLIQCLNMTEAQAHRYIEKQSMDTRVSKREVAQDIIKTYAGQPPLSDNPFSSLP